MPDTDRKGSLLSPVFPLWFLKRFRIFKKAFKHRGITHKIYGLAGFMLLVYIIFGEKESIAFGLGYASHLFLDMFTKRGIKLF